MTESSDPIDELDLLSAELALGLLDGAELVSAQQRERDDPAFAGMVSRWRARSAQWLDELEPEPVGAQMWPRIQAALGHGDALPPPAAAPLAPAIGSGTPWRGLALLACAASVALAVALGVVLTGRADLAAPPAADGGARVAQIAGTRGAPLLSAVYREGSGTLTLRVSAPTASDKAPELWVMDKAGKPRSLGLIDRGNTVTLRLSDELRQLLVDGAILAITLEQRADAPHAAPSGEVLGTATLSTL